MWRTYTGGREIGRIHGEQGAKDGHFPEEWMFSTTRALNAGREEIEEGICRLDEDREISSSSLSCPIRRKCWERDMWADGERQQAS